MNEKEFIKKFTERGYVIADPMKFYRTIRTTSLESLLDELETYEKGIPVEDYPYENFEDDVHEYLNGIRSAVNNHYSFSTRSYDRFIKKIREFADKYMITHTANDERLDINLRLTAAREELDRINADLSKANGELTPINQRRAALNKELRELSNNEEISNADKTTRTFEIMEELEKLNGEVVDKRRAVRELRTLSDQKTEELKNLQIDLNKQLSEVKDVETPAFTLEMKDELLHDIDSISAEAISITENQDDINRIESLTRQFKGGIQTVFANSKLSTYRLHELWDKYGIEKTDVATIEPPVVEEPVEEENAITRAAKSAAAVLNAPVEDIEVEEAPAAAPVEEPAEEPVVVEPPKAEPEVKKVVFLGSHSDIPSFHSEYKVLEEGKEYKIIYEDESTYRFEGFSNMSFSKAAFVPRATWDAIVAFGSKPKVEPEPEKEEDKVEPEEPKKDEENKDNSKKRLKVGDKMVFYKDEFSRIFDIFSDDSMTSPKDGDVLEITEVLPSGYKVKGHDEIVYGYNLITLEEWEKVKDKAAARSTAKDKPKPRPGTIGYSEYDKDDKHYINVVLKGFKEEDVTVEYDKDTYVLKIRAENEESIYEKDVWLPGYDPEKLKYRFDGAMLHIEISKTLSKDKPADEPVAEPEEETGIYKIGSEIVFRPGVTITPDEKAYYEEVFIKNGVEEGKVYKISTIEPDGSIRLEGISVALPPMGFMSKESYMAMPESLRDIRIFTSAEPEPELSDEPESSDEPDFVEEPRPLVDEDEEILIYRGKETARLKPGRRYILDYSFGPVAKMKDVETGETFIVNDYFPDEYEYISTQRYDAEKRMTQTFGRKLPEVIAVEKINKLTKISNTMATAGIIGLAGGVLGVATVGALAAPIIAISAITAAASIIPQSKIAHDHVLNRMVEKVKGLLGEYKQKLEGDTELDEEDIYKIKSASDELEMSLQNIRATAEERNLHIYR